MSDADHRAHRAAVLSGRGRGWSVPVRTAGCVGVAGRDAGAIHSVTHRVAVSARNRRVELPNGAPIAAADTSAHAESIAVMRPGHGSVRWGYPCADAGSQCVTILRSGHGGVRHAHSSANAALRSGHGGVRHAHSSAAPAPANAMRARGRRAALPLTASCAWSAVRPCEPSRGLRARLHTANAILRPGHGGAHPSRAMNPWFHGCPAHRGHLPWPPRAGSGSTEGEREVEAIPTRT